jgi:monoterpene epsilon-lactone hydrolase
MLRRTVKPTAGDEDLLASIRATTNRRGPPTVPGRRITRETFAGGERTSVASPQRHVLYLHGGYHLAGGPAVYRSLAKKVSAALQGSVHVLDLPAAPEHPYPAALDMAVTTYLHLLDSDVDPSTVAVAGDSSGGGLALAMMQRIRNDGLPLPGAAVLISPWLDLSCSGPSIDENDTSDDMLSATALRTAATLYAQQVPLDDPGVSPLFGCLDGLPPMYVTIDRSETLLDDTRRLVERAGATSSIEAEERAGLFHIWPVLVPYLKEARTTVSQIVRFLDRELA